MEYNLKMIKHESLRCNTWSNINLPQGKITVHLFCLVYYNNSYDIKLHKLHKFSTTHNYEL